MTHFKFKSYLMVPLVLTLFLANARAAADELAGPVTEPVQSQADSQPAELLASNEQAEPTAPAPVESVLEVADITGEAILEGADRSEQADLVNEVDGSAQLETAESQQESPTLATRTATDQGTEASPVVYDVTDKDLTVAYTPTIKPETSIHFALWSDLKGQDDLKWYQADREGAASISWANHEDYGTYHLHTYAKEAGKMTGLDATSFVRTPPVVSATINQTKPDQVDVLVMAIPAHISDIVIPVWSELKGQDDLKWYQAKRVDDQTSSLTIDLSDHNYDKGHYHVHIYGRNRGDQKLVALMGTPGFDYQGQASTQAETPKPATPSDKPAAPASAFDRLPASGSYTFTERTGVKTEPKVSSPDLAYYQKGQVVNYDRKLESDGHQWLTYINYGGGRSYVSVGKLPEAKPAEVVKPADSQLVTPAKPVETPKPVEAVTPAEAPKPSDAKLETAFDKLPASGSYTFTERTGVKTEPKVSSRDLAFYQKGQVVNYDRKLESDGHQWLTYINYGGGRSYVSVGKLPEAKPAEVVKPADSQPVAPAKPVETPKPVEAVTPAEAPKPSDAKLETAFDKLPASGSYTFTERTGVKTEPKVSSPDLAYYQKGQVVNYDRKLESDGHQWLTYINYGGGRSYVSVGKLPEAKPAEVVKPADSQPVAPAKPVETTKPVEAVAPSESKVETAFDRLPASGSYTFTERTGVKTEPKVSSPDLAFYQKGQVVNYDRKLESDGHQWLTYINYGGGRSYVSVGKLPEAKPAEVVKPTAASKPAGSAKPVETPKPVEAVTPAEAPKPSEAKVETAFDKLPASGSYTFTEKTGVKTEPKVSSPDLAFYQKGQVVNYDRKLESDGHQWLTYINYGGGRSYVSVGKLPEAKPAEVVKPADSQPVAPAKPVETPKPVEAVTPAEAPKPSDAKVETAFDKLPASGSYTFTERTGVKTEPKVSSPDRAFYEVGQVVNYDRKLESDGHQWLTYINYGGGRSYVSVGKLPEAKPAEVVKPADSQPVAPAKPVENSKPVDQPIAKINLEEVYGSALVNQASNGAKKVLTEAAALLGVTMGDAIHRQVVDEYNAVQPLPVGYKVTYTDDWCDVFTTVVFQRAGLSHLIGRECGVDRHIGIFKDLGIWNEDGTVTPQSGDIITFNWNETVQPNNGFADHIGIVSHVEGDLIHTIEGNNNRGPVRRLSYKLGHGQIRGFARPAYDGQSWGTTPTPSQSVAVKELAESGSYTFTERTGVKLEPKVSSPDRAFYEVGQVVNYDRKLENDGHQWLSYINYGGGRSYVSVGKLPEAKPAEVVKPADSQPVAPAKPVETPKPVEVATPAEAPKPSDAKLETAFDKLPASGSYTFSQPAAVKAEPKLASPSRATYQPGQVVNYDRKLESDGHQWLSYINYSGSRSYVVISPSSSAMPATSPAPGATVTYKGNYYSLQGKYDEVLVVNKKFPVSPTYAPGEVPVAKAAFLDLTTAMRQQGFQVNQAYSGYRSYAYQEAIYNNFVAQHGQAAADRFSARPGHSEHQTGLAYDLLDGSGALLQNNTAASNWLANNAHHYGFVVRYLPGKEHITGYMHEPWHIRYVGKEASDIYRSGLTLEEYYGFSGGGY